MEVVHDEPGGGQPGGDRGGIRLVGVDHHVADPGQPRRRLRAEPVGHGHGAASRENIDQTTGVEVDDPGHQHGRVLGGRRQERCLIEPDGGGCAEAGQVIDPGPAMVTHGRHRRVPGHAEVPGRLRDGVLLRADPPADLCPRPFGQDRPWGDLVDLLGPRRRWAGRLGAAPQALGPHQPDRPASDRKIAHDDPAAAVADRPRRAYLAPGSILGGLDGEEPLAAVVVEELGGHHEPVQPEQRGHAATVTFHQGPPVDAVLNKPHQ